MVESSGWDYPARLPFPGPRGAAPGEGHGRPVNYEVDPGDLRTILYYLGMALGLRTHVQVTDRANRWPGSVQPVGGQEQPVGGDLLEKHTNMLLMTKRGAGLIMSVESQSQKKPRGLDPHLWSSTFYFAAIAWFIFLVWGPGDAAWDRLSLAAWISYWAGWTGPVIALLRAIVKHKPIWNGAVIPVAIHAVLGVIFLLSYA